MASKTVSNVTDVKPPVATAPPEVPVGGEAIKVEATRGDRAEASRARAARLISERKFAEAKQALMEAEDLEAEPANWKAGPKRLFTTIRSRLPKRADKSASSDAPVVPADGAEVSPVDKSLGIVGFYSKVAVVAGILPGGLLNIAAVLTVEVTMVWRIAKTFGDEENKDKIRGSVLSLIGSVLPAGIGHGAGAAIASIPAVLLGTVVYYVAAPVLAYALTQAVGKAFIMHFESGGTLLTFDPKAFADYFLKEFRDAGGVAPQTAPVPAGETTVVA